MSGVWSWAALAGLGAFHGLNPAMGWLFAVALGMQSGRGSAVFRALVPLALGHAAAVALVIALLDTVLWALDPGLLQSLAAATLIGFGVWRLARGYRHRFRVGMVAGFRDLTLWSFLMATGHGAGLMVAPLLVALPLAGFPFCGSSPHPTGLARAGGVAWTGFLAVLDHTAAMLAMTALIAWVVFTWVGLSVLRRGWINLDLLWSGALIGVGTIILGTAGAVPAVHLLFAAR